MTPRETVADAHRRYRLAVERAAARIVRDRDEAGDVASEAFLAMLERGPDDRQAALAWLLTTARNRALNVVRDRQRAARRPLDIPEPAADAPIADAHQADLVARALSTLSERDQAAVVMRYVAEASPAEIADALGVTAPVARVVVHRATKRLRAETVRLLAGHHGADRACAERLQKLASNGIPASHDGCGACTAVADEIAALAAHSILPVAVLPVARHAAARLREFAASIKPHLSGLESRTAEAAAVLMIATGLVAPGVAPAASSPVRPVAASQQRAARIAARANPIVPQARSRVAAALPGNKTIVTDADGDAQPLVGPPAGVRVLGRTLQLPDPLNRSENRGHDIRSFATYTEAGRDGRPETLVFLMGMAAAPPRGSYYTVNWLFEGTDCTGDAGSQTASDAYGAEAASLTVSCAEPLTVITDPNHRAPSWTVEMTPSFDGHVVAFRVPLRGLEEDLRELFAPGRTLTGLTATASTSVGIGYRSVDQAPDDGTGVRYTIGER